MAEKSAVPARKPVPAPVTVVPATVPVDSHSNHEPSSDQQTPRSTIRTSYIAFLDRHMPAHKRYIGLKRRTFLLLLIALTLALLALIIGLAAGLTAGSKSKFLPLPSNKQSFTGDLTYYGTGLGACGVTSTDSDDIVSVSHFLFDHEQHGSDPNSNTLCGRKIRATRFDEVVNGERSVDLTVVDRCTGCQPTDIDVTIGAFKKLADVNDGRVSVTWAWLSDEPQ